METGNEEIHKEGQSFPITTREVLFELWFSLSYNLVYFSLYFALLLSRVICVTLHCHKMLAAQLGLCKNQPHDLQSLPFGQVEVGVFWKGGHKEKDRNGKRKAGTYYKVLATSLWSCNSTAGLIFELLLLSPFPGFWINHVSQFSAQCSWCWWLYREDVKMALFSGIWPIRVSTIRLSSSNLLVPRYVGNTLHSLCC